MGFEFMMSHASELSAGLLGLCTVDSTLFLAREAGMLCNQSCGPLAAAGYTGGTSTKER